MILKIWHANGICVSPHLISAQQGLTFTLGRLIYNSSFIQQAGFGEKTIHQILWAKLPRPRQRHRSNPTSQQLQLCPQECRTKEGWDQAAAGGAHADNRNFS